MPCTLKNNSFIGEMGVKGGAYLNFEGKCGCGLFPFEHPEPGIAQYTHPLLIYHYSIFISTVVEIFAAQRAGNGQGFHDVFGDSAGYLKTHKFCPHSLTLVPRT